MCKDNKRENNNSKIIKLIINLSLFSKECTIFTNSLANFVNKLIIKIKIPFYNLLNLFNLKLFKFNNKFISLSHKK